MALSAPLSSMPSALPRRRVLACALVLAGSLSACASLNTVGVDVQAFGGWPAGRSPGRYVFDRLPSQQAAAGAGPRQAVEAAAAGALAAVGFKAAERAEEAELLVRVDSRLQRVLDPAFEFGVGVGIGRGWSRWGGPRYPWGWRGWGPEPVAEVREVDLLLVDRRSQQVLYEAHARLDGRAVMESLLPAMFEATLQGFPALVAGQRRVVVSLGAD